MQFFSEAVNSTANTCNCARRRSCVSGASSTFMEGYGNDNPGAKSQGIKQLMAGGGVVLIGTSLIPLLSGLF